MLTPHDVAPFAPTDKQAGDLVFGSGRADRVQPNGSWESLDWADTTPTRHEKPTRDNRMGLILAVFGIVIVPLAAILFALNGMSGGGL